MGINNFNSRIKVKDIRIKSIYPEVTADVEITLSGNTVIMKFYHPTTPYESTRLIRCIAPKIGKMYGIEELNIYKSFVDEGDKSFSISFEHPLLTKSECAIEDAVRNILFKNHVKDTEIKEIKLLNSEHNKGFGIIQVSLDIGYDEETEEDKIYKHSKFIANKLFENLFIKAIVDIA